MPRRKSKPGRNQQGSGFWNNLAMFLGIMLRLFGWLTLLASVAWLAIWVAEHLGFMSETGADLALIITAFLAAVVMLALGYWIKRRTGDNGPIIFDIPP